MANIWIILYPYSSSRRIRKLAVVGILSLLTLYIFIFLKTTADIKKYKVQLAAWNSRFIRALTFAKLELPPDWQNVGMENSNFSVYSAFSFQDSPNQVIIVGSYPDFLRDEVLRCRFYYSAGERQDEVIIVEADHELIPGWKTGDAGIIIKCSFPKTNANPINASNQNMPSPGENKATFVSILSGNRTEHWNRLPIQYKSHIGSHNYTYDFSICVPPLNPSNNNLFHFLEWLEYYKIMGVQHFSFYNLSLETNNSCILEHLLDPDADHSSKNDVGSQVENHQWHYPTIEGESSALLDCHLRHKGSSKNVGVISLNEFITPDLNVVSNFQQLIKSLVNPNQSGSSFADFWFLKKYVDVEMDNESEKDTATKCDRLMNNTLENRVCLNLLFIQSTRIRGDKHAKEDKLSGESGKYIMIPERVRIAGLHQQANILEKGYKTKRVPEKIAYIRYIRPKENEKGIKERSLAAAVAGISTNQTSRDQINLKVAFDLARNVAKSVKFFMKKCGLKENDILKPLH